MTVNGDQLFTEGFIKMRRCIHCLEPLEDSWDRWKHTDIEYESERGFRYSIYSCDLYTFNPTIRKGSAIVEE